MESNLPVEKGHKKTKYILLVGDGMGDYPLKELGGKTPLEAAEIPNMDLIASCRIGLVKTIPEGLEPGSDIANLALLGYDPRLYHTGRAPLEAISMGVCLKDNQVAFRMNLVSLDARSKDEIIMMSHSAGDISTEESAEIVRDLQKALKIPGVTIYPGVAYRHLLVWEDGPGDVKTIPPHDVLDQDMTDYLNNTPEDPIPQLIRKSWDILKDHPKNLVRRRKGLKEANSVWLWGQGRAPEMPLFRDRYGLEGGVVSGVDLMKGIGVSVGFRPIQVEGATGYLDTNYRGKAEGALMGLKELDFIFIHVEAPDEASHNGNYREKIQALEALDQQVVGVLLEGLKEWGDYRIMVISDHLTPISKKTHTSEPTPFSWASKMELESRTGKTPFTEKAATDSGLMFDEGHELMPEFLDGG